MNLPDKITELTRSGVKIIFTPIDEYNTEISLVHEKTFSTGIMRNDLLREENRLLNYLNKLYNELSALYSKKNEIQRDKFHGFDEKTKSFLQSLEE